MSGLARIVLGWGAFVALTLSGDLLAAPVPAPLLIAALAGIVLVIVIAAFGVVTQAESLAHRLGDPYGTLILTLSIVLIEVVLISAILLGPGAHPTIARDSVMAVSMIIVNLVVGAALVVGGRRHRDGLTVNRTGTRIYLVLLVLLCAVAFALPKLIGVDGSYTAAQAVVVAVGTLGLYAFFLYRQTGPDADAFREPGAAAEPKHPPAGRVWAEHRREILTRIALLVVTAIPIVLLSHDLASLLDDGLARLGAPEPLAGLLIAAIVFLPESLTAIRAGRAGETTRVSNLCHGALVSTVGLTIPAVLVIGLLTGKTVVLAESGTHLILLAVSLALSFATFGARRIRAWHGALHLLVFAVYALVLFV
ncbi:calcium:proton antiporter [Gordonia phosphorivorans]|uniref:Calcium:proton antiporter n=1 Tax=Gordonia phosphorivorans TaxID=1056982 RepID=A0ABV6HBH6_9ACTN